MEQTKPVLLQINDDEFPKGFLQELAAIPPPTTGAGTVALATTQQRRTMQLTTNPAVATTLYQPVQRVTHLALVQLTCESVGYPRLDPKRVISAGMVIRRVPLNNGYTNLSGTVSPWVRNPAGNSLGYSATAIAWTTIRIPPCGHCRTPGSRLSTKCWLPRRWLPRMRRVTRRRSWRLPTSVMRLQRTLAYARDPDCQQRSGQPGSSGASIQAQRFGQSAAHAAQGRFALHAPDGPDGGLPVHVGRLRQGAQRVRLHRFLHRAAHDVHGLRRVRRHAGGADPAWAFSTSTT